MRLVGICNAINRIPVKKISNMKFVWKETCKKIFLIFILISTAIFLNHTFSLYMSASLSACFLTPKVTCSIIGMSFLLKRSTALSFPQKLLPLSPPPPLPPKNRVTLSAAISLHIPRRSSRLFLLQSDALGDWFCKTSSRNLQPAPPTHNLR